VLVILGENHLNSILNSLVKEIISIINNNLQHSQ
jgi:hypothetical protein